MKTTPRFVLSILASLAVGYGAGVYTAQYVRDHHAPPQRSVETEQLVAARARLAQLQTHFTEAHPAVQDQIKVIAHLESKQN